MKLELIAIIFLLLAIVFIVMAKISYAKQYLSQQDKAEKYSNVSGKVTLFSTKRILINANAASQKWPPQNTGISGTVYCIKAVDEIMVWAGVANGVFLNTTNGGQSWKTITSLPENHIYTLDFVSGKNGQLVATTIVETISSSTICCTL